MSDIRDLNVGDIVIIDPNNNSPVTHCHIPGSIGKVTDVLHDSNRVRVLGVIREGKEYKDYYLTTQKQPGDITEQVHPPEYLNIVHYQHHWEIGDMPDQPEFQTGDKVKVNQPRSDLHGRVVHIERYDSIDNTYLIIILEGQNSGETAWKHASNLEPLDDDEPRPLPPLDLTSHKGGYDD